MNQLFIVSGPSGVGKTSLLKEAVAESPGVSAAVSHTTRPRRRGEVHGRDYHFVSPREFEAMRAAGRFLENAEIFGHRYGTSRDAVTAQLAAGRGVVLEIDWQGAGQIKARAAELSSRSLFILPPSEDALRARLEGRGQDSAAVIRRRLREAFDEMSRCTGFDEILVNDDFAAARRALLRFFADGALDAACRKRAGEVCRTLGLTAPARRGGAG